MKSHDLAKALLSLPNLDVGTSAMGHSFSSCLDVRSHGPLMIGRGRLGSKSINHIVIGNMLEMYKSNYVEEILFEAPERKGVF